MMMFFWYERHTRLCPITGRKQFVFLTQNQINRVAVVIRNGVNIPKLYRTV